MQLSEWLLPPESAEPAMSSNTQRQSVKTSCTNSSGECKGFFDVLSISLQLNTYVNRETPRKRPIKKQQN